MTTTVAPDFNANCISSCSFAENSRLNSVLVNFQRTDADTDQISYSLRDSFNGKFKIDSDSGEIRLGKKLDFESSASYELEVFATDETGIEVKKDISINVTDVDYSLRANYQVSNEKIRVSDLDIFIKEDIDDKINIVDRKILEMESDSENPTYSLSGTHANRYEINNKGEIFIKNNSSSIDYGDGPHNIIVTELIEDETENPSKYINI